MSFIPFAQQTNINEEINDWHFQFSHYLLKIFHDSIKSDIEDVKQNFIWLLRKI